MEILGRVLARKAISEKRNIVMEIIGNEEEECRSLIDAMVAMGYKISLQQVYCDPAEAHKRHMKAVEEDPHYISAYFTSSYHMKWILDAVKDLLRT